MNYPVKSPIQYQQHEDGSLFVIGAAAARVESCLDTEPRDIYAEFNLPDDPAALEALARPHGVSERRIRFILCDESQPTVSGILPRHPLEWSFATNGQLLTLEHTGLVVGMCEKIYPGHPEVFPHAIGGFLVGEGVLFDSKLADVAWQNIAGRVLTHVCATVLHPLGNSSREGELLEVALTARPLIPGARLLKMWVEVSLAIK